MKKLFKLFLCIFTLFFVTQVSQADEYKVLVLPDNIQFESTNYYVYPDASTIFASDTINELKKDGRIKTVSMTEVRDALRTNTKLNLKTKNALKEFKYNYNVPFVDFREIAHYFSTDKVLVITSQTDVQSYFMRRTLWDFLNIPGASVIDPAYKMSTYAVLIDVDKEEVLWENTFYKTIAAVECRMIAQNFAPATEQLERIKSYSNYFLSQAIARTVEKRILPKVTPSVDNIVNVSDKKTTESIQPIQEAVDLKPRIVAPVRTRSKNYGAIVNDL